jgi:prepilin-type processing-associated H-X9-DG protein
MPSGVPGSPGDYAASIGSTGADYPISLTNGIQLPPNGALEAFNGVPFKRITDGLSNTILVGDKHVPLGHFADFPWDCSIYDGHNPVCNTRAAGPGYPLVDSMRDMGWKFGSYHSGICQFAFCDGSVHILKNSISENVLGLLANKSDGQVIPDY